MTPVPELRNEIEVFQQHRLLPQILREGHYVPNAHIAVGYASNCWVVRPRFRWFPWLFLERVFDTENAQRLANELCAYMRLLKEGRVE